MKRCTCNAWVANIPKIDGICGLAANHRMPYDGELFNFCPWCGKELEKSENAAEHIYL